MTSARKEQLYRYAADLVLGAATEVEFLTVHEVAAEHGVHDLTDAEAERVHDLTHEAIVRVSWRGHEYVYGESFEDDDEEDDE